MKSRIRHIKQNYLEPCEGYTKVHGGPGIGVIIKEMSFGVATNYFFLMPTKAKKIVLARVFKEKMTLRQFLYKLVLNHLKQLTNQEPYELASEKIHAIVQDYLVKYSIEKVFLTQVFEDEK